MWTKTKRWLGAHLARYLAAQRTGAPSIAVIAPDELRATLRAGDVLLVEGHTRFSLAIQYLTQSNWSHSALCIKDARDCRVNEPCLVEADIKEGVRLVSLDTYTALPTRICRPMSLRPNQTQAVIDFACARLGHQYDVQKVSDLVRYLLPKPPVPEAWRRQMLAFGSGDPTRAICSTLIAQAFLHVGYPILPLLKAEHQHIYARNYQEWQRIRKHQLYTPRDFDISPYFAVIKPDGFASYANWLSHPKYLHEGNYDAKST